MLKAFLDLYYKEFKTKGESFDEFVNRITYVGIDPKEDNIYRNKSCFILQELGATNQQTKDIWEARQPMKFLSVTT